MKPQGLFTRVALALGLVFLYVPIVSMIVFSFNNSRLVTVWDAAHSPTLKWYGVLVHNEQILTAAWLSIRIAVTAASAAVVLGTLAGVALARLGAFRGRLLLAGMVTAPIVMPEVITGLSLLLMFVALGQLIGWPQGVGAVTIALAHITFWWRRRPWTWERGRSRCFSASPCRASCRRSPRGGCWRSPCRGMIW